MTFQLPNHVKSSKTGRVVSAWGLLSSPAAAVQDFSKGEEGGDITYEQGPVVRAPSRTVSWSYCCRPYIAPDARVSLPTERNSCTATTAHVARTPCLKMCLSSKWAHWASVEMEQHRACPITWCVLLVSGLAGWGITTVCSHTHQSLACARRSENCLSRPSWAYRTKAAGWSREWNR